MRSLALCLCISLISCQGNSRRTWSEDQLRAVLFPPKQVYATYYVAYSQGHWRQIRFGVAQRIPVLNAVSIRCIKHENTCAEVRAELDSPLDKPATFGENVRLGIEQPEIFDVQSWSADDTILAKQELDWADVELRISTRDKTVEKTYRETRARGSSTANPSIVHVWVLE
jgi:hypothetical protein